MMDNSMDGGNPAGARRRSYEAGGRVARERMRQEAPEQAAALEEVEAGDIVVVRGTYDHVELVLDALHLPYNAVEPAAVGRLRLSPGQLVVVNCPGQIGRDGVAAVRRFVEAGGTLFTTDWALRHVVEPAFPGVIAYNGRPTGDEVVRIEVLDGCNRFLDGVLDGDDDPLWWLEASSYPIQVLDPARVQVLVRSRELADRHGEGAVAVLFGHGPGEVFHMISHYYLQRTELRSARHAAPAAAYAAEKQLQWIPGLAQSLAGLSLADVESAQSSARLFANVVADKKRRSRDGGRG